jgi:exodeoxyribonuclease X-like protein
MNDDFKVKEDNYSYALSIIENMDINNVENSMNKIYKFQKVIQKTLVEGHDYGKTFYGSSKPSLLKPGAEKILMLLGISSEYEIIDKVQNYEDGFFAFSVKSILKKNEKIVTEGLGHSNSRERKYLGGKQDVYMLGNTCLKMAKKRALVDATLTVASLSDIFTQDMEDITQFEEEERVETMSLNDAKNIKVTFGKYNGKTLGEIHKNDKGYINWLCEKSRDDGIARACKMLLSSDFDTEEVQQKADRIPPE